MKCQKKAEVLQTLFPINTSLTENSTATPSAQAKK
jgi:hypothetical protein